MKLSLCNVLAVTHTHTHSVNWAQRLSSFSSAEVSTTESSKAQTCQKGEILFTNVQRQLQQFKIFLQVFNTLTS